MQNIRVIYEINDIINVPESITVQGNIKIYSKLIECVTFIPKREVWFY